MSVHPIPLPTAATPLADYLRQEWLPRHEPTWASGSRRHRRWTVAILCDSPLANRPIGDLGVLEIERYFAERAGQPFPQKGQLPARGSLRAIFATLKSCLGDAVRYSLIPDNPCTRVRLPQEPSAEIDIWTVEEVRRVLAATARRPQRPPPVARTQGMSEMARCSASGRRSGSIGVRQRSDATHRRLRFFAAPRAAAGTPARLHAAPFHPRGRLAGLMLLGGARKVGKRCVFFSKARWRAGELTSWPWR